MITFNFKITNCMKKKMDINIIKIKCGELTKKAAMTIYVSVAFGAVALRFHSI